MLYYKLRTALGRRNIRRGGGRGSLTALMLLIVVAAFLIAAIPVSKFLKNIAGQMALSDATDKITATINDKINEKMSQGQYDYDYFVSLQKDAQGNITAISANMTRINTLSSEILQ